MKKFSYLIAILAMAFSVQSQTIETKVQSELQFGSYFYYYLVNDNTVFKSSAFPSSELRVGQAVELTPSETSSDFDITNPRTIHPATARKLTSDNTFSGMLSNLDGPKLDGEILFFRDTTHLYSFYEQINALGDSIEDYEYSVLLDSLELMYPSFTSFGSYLDRKYGDTLTEREFIELEKEEFISDVTHQSLFNQYRLLGISDRIYLYHDLNQIISVHKDSLEAVDYLERISRIENYDIYDPYGPILYDSTYLFEENELVTFTPLFSLIDTKVISNNKSVYHISSESVTFQSIPEQFHFVEECNPYKKELRIPVYIEQTYYNPQGGVYKEQSLYNLQNAILTVDWGDGNIETINNYSGGLISHSYSNLGNYQVQTELLFNSSYGPIVLRDGNNSNQAAAHHLPFAVGLACTSAEAARWKHTDVGNWRLRTKIWVNNNIFGKHAGSYSEGYKYTWGSWSAKKTRIKTTIDADFRDDQCVYSTNKDGSKERNNSKNVSKSKTLLFKPTRSVANSDVTSTHRLIEGSTVITRSMVLNVCN